ncbi:uncharacterized mitochondrial protein AtMg00810-like [Cryptomeria japonica]|uniref:uncharacterized mitochondrial protein AtMg00810-like n=1 Tax=Cryptomeria japonica TaxID=3369 RepID=UPI0025AB9FB1|nr:uncharacterized mitochondrial protein AtMg00810-like [Cryptomeria japonica]
MADCKPALTPFPSGAKLDASCSSPLADATLYRQLVGSIIYLTHTRPDTSYVVGLVSRFMQGPHELHWKAAKRILHYVQGTHSYGIHYTAGMDIDLNIVTEFGISFRKPTVIFCENKHVIQISRNMVHHQWTKHIEINMHYIRELIHEQVLDLQYCLTSDQIAGMHLSKNKRKGELPFISGLFNLQYLSERETSSTGSAPFM